MIVCIPSSGSSPESQVDDRFGRAHSFFIYNTDNDSYDVFANPHREGSGGVGLKVVQELASKGVTHLIAPQIGGNADGALKSAEIIHIPCKAGVGVRTLYESWKAGEL